MSEENKVPVHEKPEYSLNDDRRVKVLSPGALVAKRFFRNRLAVIGLVMLIALFIFSFIGGAVIPYGQAQQFYKNDTMSDEYVAVTRNDDLRYYVAEGKDFGKTSQAQFLLAQVTGKTEFSYKDSNYRMDEIGPDLYAIYDAADNTLLACAYKDIVQTADDMPDPSFDVRYNALCAYVGAGPASFSVDGEVYTLDEQDIVNSAGELVAYISRFVVASKIPGTPITRQFKEELEATIDVGGETFSQIGTNDEGEEVTFEYDIVYDPATNIWSVKRETTIYVYDSYAFPSKAHPLGLDKNGMDMLTRLMYGGRISLMVGFIVVGIEVILGVIMGGISGYFGGWVDNLIMRIVDIFYCIPSLPLMIILGAAMDGVGMSSNMRLLMLMLTLGFLGWPGVARMVRGQILSLREQEFMTAAEACGISASRRIFRHLIPNVIPQLIVLSTMGLGSTIITEATLSFLGLGVKFPFASWGNLISDVNNAYVLTNYLFIWIPAGVCLLIAVLGFNFVGDGLRDAFDPKMKR